MSGESERIEEEARLHQLAGFGSERTVLEEQVHDRTPQHHHEDRRRQREEQDPADRLLQGALNAELPPDLERAHELN